MFDTPKPVVALNVYVGRGTAIIPHKKRNIHYTHFAAEPVITVPIQVEPLAAAIEQVREAVEAEPLASASDEEFARLLAAAKGVPLKAAGVRTWKALAKDFVCYMLSWSNERVSVRPSRLDRAGRYEFHDDYGGYQGPAISTTEIARIIIEDYTSRDDG